MVSAGYALDRAPPPSSFKRFVDQRALPVAIDVAGSVEAAVESAAQLVRRQPVAAVLIAAALGYAMANLLGSRSRIYRS